MPRFSRRHAISKLVQLAGLPLIGAGASAALAIGPRSQVGMGHLKHGGDWDHRPEALRRVLWETGRRTSINVAKSATKVSPLDEGIFHQPLLVLTGEQALPAFTAKERSVLQRHLRFGGLLWIDTPSPNAPFVTGVRAEIATLMADDALAPLPADHVMFKSYFLLDRVVGRTTASTRLLGAQSGGRTSVLFTQCDVLGALERDRFGTWRFDCEPGGERQREMAMRFAVNVLMYATCLDYKTDQVHIPFIMKKKRR